METDEQSGQTAPTQTFKNRRGGLIAFGVLQLLIAAVVFLIAGSVLLIPSAEIAKSQPPGAPAVSFASISIFYCLIGILFATLGIGSILAKNWARVGTLVVCWFWLVMGITSLLFTAFLLPTILRTAPRPQQNLPPNFEQTAVTAALVFVGIVFVVLPGIFLLFYHGKNVKATCLSGRTPEMPARPLLMSFLIALFGLSILAIPFIFISKYPVIVFGQLLWGWSGKLLFAVAVFAELYAMWAYIRWNVTGWWVALVANIFWMCSAFVTFALTRDDLFDLYRKMGMTEQQLSMFSVPHFLNSILIATGVIMSARLAAIIYSKRYFPQRSSN